MTEEFDIPTSSGLKPKVFFDEEDSSGMHGIKTALCFLFSGLSPPEEEIWFLIKDIRDPEYPYTLSQLRVVSPQGIRVHDIHHLIIIFFKPTVPTCSLSAIIGLALRKKIESDFMIASEWKLIIMVYPGSHSAEIDLNRQFNDKERIAAANDNPNVMKLVNGCILCSF